MRSRYTAYVLGLERYLLATWHRSTRPAALGLGEAVATKWLGLDVLCHALTGPASAMVEFVARSRVGGRRAVRLHEVSRFVLEDGAWFYLDGEIPGR
jgi:SEC-C motif domain protein